MLIKMENPSGGGGDITIQTGTLNVSASSLTFDCGFEPDMVYMIQISSPTRDNDWFAVYQKEGAFDNQFPAKNLSYLYFSNSASYSGVNYKLSVSGSIVTFPNYSNFYGSTWNWIAFKKN